MSVIIVDFDKSSIYLEECDDTKGLLTGLELYKKYNNSLVITSSSKEIYETLGTSVYTFVYTSPITSNMDFSYDGGPFGLALKMLGYDALVIKGKAEEISYITIYQNNIEILSAHPFQELDNKVFEKGVKKYPFDIVLSTSLAAEKGLNFASLLSGESILEGQGLGSAFQKSNIRGIVVQGFPKTDFDKKLKSKERKIIEKSKFAHKLKRWSNNSLIDDGIRLGWLNIDYYSGRQDPRCVFLDGLEIQEEFGNYPETCLDCFLSCYRRTKDGVKLPNYREMMSVGLNLNLFSIKDVAKVLNKVRELGFNPEYVGPLLAYIVKDKKMEKSVETYLMLLDSLVYDSSLECYIRDGLGKESLALGTNRGKAICYELRNNYPAALSVALGYDFFLPSSTFLPKKKLSVKSSSLSSTYETLYYLAFLSLGINPLSSISLYWERVNPRVFNVPLVYSYYLKHFRILSYKTDELLELGSKVYSLLSPTLTTVPDYFRYNPTPNKDKRIVPIEELKKVYMHQKLSLDLKLKSIKSKRAIKEGKIKAALGPDEDRG